MKPGILKEWHGPIPGNVYPNRNLNYDVDNMVGLARKFDLDGIIFHSNRSCKTDGFPAV